MGAVIQEAETEDLRRLADDLRRELHPDDAVTYVVDRNINYSNVCFSVCNFCAFYRKPGHPEGYVLGYDEIFEKVEEMIELGGSGVLMQGGLHPDLPMEWYTGLLSQLKQRYGIHLHCFSPTEIYGMSKTFGMSYEQVIRELRDAGLDSIPGGGGEILVDEIRRKRRTECNSQEWLDVMEAAHQLGIKTTATMMIGYGETSRSASSTWKSCASCSGARSIRTSPASSRSSPGHSSPTTRRWARSFLTGCPAKSICDGSRFRGSTSTTFRTCRSRG